MLRNPKVRSSLSCGCVGAIALGAPLLLAGAASAQWVSFVNDTSTRMPVGPGLNTAATSTGDLDEKDYAWGDIDQDGDIDLVCVRKQPFTSPGRRPNVLFMNEGVAEGHAINGVLVDRTLQYASASTVAGDQGFLTATNDRDVVLVDVNNDGWLDIVTATTLSDGQPFHIAYPRVYINLGEVRGVWQGFRFEHHRIPNMTPASAPNATPRFCSVAAGDVTGDGYVDLYFGDYDSGGTQLFDFNNRLLINRGAAEPGVFDDSGTSRISAAKLQSAFGAASIIADMNNDGAIDVVKQTSLASPTHIAIHHNNPANVGYFADDKYKQWTGAIYFVSAGDLNNDGRLDLIITDDGYDSYMLNTGNAADGTATFSTISLGPPSSGFGSQSLAVDLNNDGWQDILIADVDVDISGCSRRLHIYRNLGNAPNVSMQEQAIGGLENSSANMSGTHNVAVFDLDGDGWKDIILGRCSGTFIWRQVPPAGIAFTYPEGLPANITPEQTTIFDVQLTGISGAQIAPGSGKIFVSVDNGPFVQSNMTSLGGNLYEATLPASECTSRVRYYFSGQLSSGATITDPPSAPTESYVAVAAVGTELSLEDTIEGSVAGWTISSDATLTAGAWEQATPNPTFWNAVLAAPDEDATGGIDFTKAFVTLNGPPGDLNSGAYDIDGGATMLVSPVIDLDGADANISYSRWFFSSLPGNYFRVEVSNDNGSTWTTVDQVNSTITGPNGETVWGSHSFLVGAFVTPSAQVRVRFTANGAALNSVAEAGLDNFRVQKILCDGGQPCAGDINGSGAVDADDLIAVILGWGPCGNPDNCPADVNSSGAVDVDDLIAVILGWGACP